MGDIDLIVRTKIKYVGAFGGAFSSVDDIAAAFMKAIAVQATKPVFEAVFSHVIPIAPATAEPVRKVIGGTAAGNLATAPVGFPAGN
ncbi:hypothetical protein [uncultured Pantoea sp.]|uniref:hypothetical protein n=1 Tax=uncultured Pantoea sp. TaxID=218084 RepID=UPI0025D65A06|nr:hypothetical protein [uncultured Pantoea sp.]